MLRRAALAVLIFFVLWPPALHGAGKLRVVVSLFPYREFAREIGGERVRVRMLVPPGAEVHSWEPTPSDILVLREADVFIYTGLGMEPYLEELLKAAGREGLFVMEAARGLDLLMGEGPAREGGFDPHVWLDLESDVRIAGRIADIFSRKDPGGEKYYRKRAGDYIESLRALDEKYRKGLSRCRAREFFTGGHAAFGYLARRYGLKQAALFGVNPDSEPTPRDMARLIRLGKEKRASVVFFEELVNPRLAQVLAKELGAETLTLNPGANVTPEEIKQGLTFIEIMEKNLKNLRKGLGCE